MKLCPSHIHSSSRKKEDIDKYNVLKRITINQISSKLKHTAKVSLLSSHFNIPFTSNAWNKSFNVEDGDPTVSTTDLHDFALMSNWCPIPRTLNVLKASYVSLRLERDKIINRQIDAIEISRYTTNISYDYKFVNTQRVQLNNFEIGDQQQNFNIESTVNIKLCSSQAITDSDKNRTMRCQ